MAAITTQTTLKAEYLVLLAELDRLTDVADYKTGETIDCAGLHTAAWAAVLRDINRKRGGLTESDLTDTSELQHACHLWILHRLYDQSELEQDRLEAKRWLQRYNQEIGEVQLTVAGLETAGASEDTMLVRG